MIIKIGVVGARRGRAFMKNTVGTGLELAAVCDIKTDKYSDIPEAAGAEIFDDFDKFLRSDIDAVILANYFHEHAPLAIKALSAGKHVMSECQAAVSMSECVRLTEAVEESGKIYMLAENYPFFAYNREMKRLYDEGEIGTMQYAEGEYIHPDFTDSRILRSPGFDHWRNRLPATYYCSHSLAPIMYITNTMPKSVNSLVIPKSPYDHQTSHEIYLQDRASVILVRMDNESVIRLLQPNLRGHGNWYSIHGTSGLMENLRSEGNKDKLRIFHDDVDIAAGKEKEIIYTPEYGEFSEAEKAGHGGGDFFTNFYFAEAIRKNEQPYLDVYKASAIAAVGIQSFRSALDNGTPYPIPDFCNANERSDYFNDHYSPFAEEGSFFKLPYSVYDYPTITDEAKNNALSIWNKN
jgi:predicted dehydrogenase